MTLKFRKNQRSTAGNAMVEFALAMGLFMPMLLGTFQFGYAFYTYNRLIAAVREGARYGALCTYDSATSTPSTAYSTAVKNMVVYGSPTAGTTPVVSGLATSNVAVSVTMSSGVPDMVTVSLNNYSLNAIVKNLTLVNKPQASFRFEGRFEP